MPFPCCLYQERGGVSLRVRWAMSGADRARQVWREWAQVWGEQVGGGRVHGREGAAGSKPLFVHAGSGAGSWWSGLCGVRYRCRVCDGMRGTGVGYAAMLRSWYAMSGTDVACAAARD
eukprot:3412020-Rhodomonas_salina.1